jgi:hypothetical protein
VTLPIAIEVTNPDLLTRLSQLLGPFALTRPFAHVHMLYHIDYAEGAYRLRTDDIDLTADSLEALIGLLLDDLAWRLAGRSDLGLLHAAALACDGQALLLPGPSGSGKSTLAARLIHHGFRYLSDEFVPLSCQTVPATVSPYPVPLRIKSHGIAQLAESSASWNIWPVSYQAGKERIHYVIPHANVSLLHDLCPLRLIVFPARAITGTTTVHKLTAGVAALKLMRDLINADRLGAHAPAIAVDLAQRIPCYDLTSSQADAGVHTIMALWRSHAASPC